MAKLNFFYAWNKDRENEHLGIWKTSFHGFHKPSIYENLGITGSMLGANVLY